MIFFAIETSTERSAVGAVDGEGRVVGEESFEGNRLTTGPLFSVIHRLWGKVVVGGGRVGEEVVVVAGTGPGSYSGVRVAIAAAEGLGMGIGARVCGISSLLGVGEGRYAVVGNARGGQYFFAVVGDGGFELEPGLYEPAEAVERARAEGVVCWVGGGVGREEWMGLGYPSAVRLARLVARAWREGGEEALVRAEPMYLKEAHITRPREERSIRGQAGFFSS